MDDPHPWRAAIGLGVLSIATGMFVSSALQTMLGHGWWTPGDAWASLRAGHYVSQGTLPLIYEAGTTRVAFDSGPLLPMLLAPVAALGNLLHLQESYPFPSRHPNMWLVLGPYGLASAIPLMYAVRALATQCLVRTGRLLLQCVVLTLAFAPMAIVYGHYEDVLALSLLLLACRDLFAGRELRGALFVAAAIAFKQTSLLAVPVYVAACPPAIRPRVAARSLVAPALVFAFFLLTDYTYASEALLHPPTYAALGHAALWISPSADYVGGVPSRAGAFVVALVIAWLVRHKREPATILAALGCVLFSRLFFESVVHAYYVAPGITFLLLAERMRGGRIVGKATVAAALVLSFPFHPNRVLWWIVAYALAAALLVGPLRRIADRPRAARSEYDDADGGPDAVALAPV